MQLGKTETFRILNDHHRRIGYVHSDFNHGSRYHDLRFAFHKSLHLEILVFHRHLPMDNADLVLWLRKFIRQSLQSSLQIEQIHFFTFFDQGIHHIYLPALADFLFHKTKHPQAAALVQMQGFDGFAAGRQFVDHRNIQITVQGHGQGPGDRCGCHDQHMGGNRILAPQPGPLLHSEAVLFIDHHQAQVVKPDCIFDQCMGTDQNIQTTILQLAMDHPAILFWSRTGQ